MDNNSTDPLVVLMNKYRELVKTGVSEKDIQFKLDLDDDTFKELVSLVEEEDSPSTPVLKKAGATFKGNPDQMVEAAEGGGAVALGSLSGAASGAAMGLMFGPWGAAAGALIGGVVGFFKARKQKKEVEATNASNAALAEKQQIEINEQDRQARAQQSINDASSTQAAVDNQQELDTSRAMSRNADSFKNGGVVDYSNNLYANSIKLQLPMKSVGIGSVTIHNGKLIPSKLPGTFTVNANNPKTVDSVGITVGNKRMLVNHNETIAFIKGKAIITNK